MEKFVTALTVVLSVVSAGEAAPSYGELAEQLTYPQYNASVTLLPTLTNTSQPGDPSIHTLRKGLILIRDYLDMFVYAFPNATGTNGTDVWKKLREDFNVGYVAIGNFQDLNASRVNYTHHEYEVLLQKCLEWKAGFLKHESEYNYDTYVQHPSTDELFIRPDKELSQFYWEYAHIIPDLQISGLGNIARLEAGLLNLTATNYSRVFNLTHVYTKDGQIIFHDYRKLIRSVITVFGEFAIVNQAANCTKNAESILKQAYTLFGDLHDLITAYDFYKKHNNQNEEKILEAKIDAGWQSLQVWMNQNAFLDQVRCLLQNLIPITLNWQ